jgi:hypothetical protein
MEGGWSVPGRPRLRVVARAVPLLFVSALSTAAMVGSSHAAGGALTIQTSPVSDGVKMALAFRAGDLSLRSGRGLQGSAQLPASPGLTVLPNVKASDAGVQPVNEVPITADPVTPTHLESGANDYSCTTLQGFYNSDDAGATWRHHCMPVIGTGNCGDPSVAYDRDGNAYIGGIGDCGSTGSFAIQSSPDNGLTWGRAHIAFGPLLGGLVDKPWMEADQSATSPFVNCLYTSWTDFNSSLTKTRASVAHSCDGGTTWTRVAVDVTQAVPKIDQFTDLAIGPDGTVYLTWMYCKTSSPRGDCGNTIVDLKFSKSTDGGNTWSAPVVMATAHNAPDIGGCYYGCFPGSRERLSNIPVIDIDDSTGTLNVAYYTYFGGNTRVKAIRSVDTGATWSTPIEPITNPGSQGWPWLSQNGTSVGITFDHSATSGSFIYVAAFSFDDGATYPTTARLSTATSKFENDGFTGGFIGDYTGNIWTGTTLHASWADARSAPAVDMTGGANTP